MPTDAPAPPTLWDFAVEVYARDGVASLCLRLQDEHGLDVDVVLACAWWGAYGGSIDDTVLRHMLTAAAPAHARVDAIRQLRRAVGRDRAEDPAWAETHERLEATELAAERVELLRIETALRGIETPSGRPSTHARPRTDEALRRYARHCGAKDGDPLLQALLERILPAPCSDRR